MAKKVATSGSGSAGGKRGAAAEGKKAMRLMAATKHKKSRIGLTKNLHIVTDGVTVNTFRVYGDSIGSANQNTATDPDHKHVKTPTAKHYTFNLISWSDIDDNTIEINCTATRTFGPFWAMDDLTVTIVMDELTPDPDTTECTFDDVDYV
jgi:hypothetical protein